MKYWGEIKEDLMKSRQKKGLSGNPYFLWNDVSSMLQSAMNWGAEMEERKFRHQPSESCAKYGHVYESDCDEHYSYTCSECGEMDWERFLYNDAHSGGDWGGTRYSGYIPYHCKDCGAIVGGNNRRIPEERNFDWALYRAKRKVEGSSHIFYSCYHSKPKDDGTIDVLLLDNTIFRNVKNFKEFRQAWIERMRIE